MKCFYSICVCLFVSAGLVNAQSAKTNIATVGGIIYSNVVVQRVEPDGITLMMKTGITKLGFPELPEELQKQYKYNVTNAAAYSLKMKAAQSQYYQNVRKSDADAAAKAKADADIAATNSAAQKQGRDEDASAASESTTRRDKGAALRGRIGEGVNAAGD